MEAKYVVVAGVIVRPDGCVLLQKRSLHRDFPGKWEFPGGKVEKGESLEDALVRELFEELGVVVSVNEHICTVVWDSDSGPIPIIFQRCSVLVGKPTPKDAEAIAWVGPECVADYNLIHSNVAVVAKLAKYKEEYP